MSMIQLTKKEAITYEGLKQGLTLKEISAQAGVNIEAVRQYVRLLLKNAMIVRHGANRRSYTYSILEKPYLIGDRRPNQRVKAPFDAEADKFLLSAMNVKLTEDQLFYLKQHRSQNRTRVAKRLGLTKLEVCFAYEKLA